MRCDELKDLIPLHLLDATDEAEKAALREHLDGGCPRCAAEIAASRETLALLPYSLTPVEPSPMVKSRMMAAIRKESASAPAPTAATGTAPRPAAPAARPAWVQAWPLAAAAGLAGLLIGAYVSATMTGRAHAIETARLRETLEAQQSQIGFQAEELASLKREVRDARDSIQMVSSPAVKIFDMAGQPPLQQAAARVFWDRNRSAWHVYAANLPKAAPGKTYQLWFITETAKISAGIFDSNDAGEAIHRITVPADTGAILAAAVTDEPAGGSAQPTGSILLLGKT